MKIKRKQFSLNKFSNLKISLENFFLILIVFGIPLNLYKNRFYDNSWTVGEWLISYAGGFVRRGLIGEIIHIISIKFLISPIFLVWIFSVFAIVSLAALLVYFCKDLFDKSLLLSQLMILGPISEDYLVRKDAFIVLLYGLCLLALKKWNQKKINKIACIISVNIFSIIAIISHESYGIWGLPSLIIIFYLFERCKNKNVVQSFSYSLLFIIPSLSAFLLCWINRGSVTQSLMIHKSWQAISNILPSLGSLNLPQPIGAIDAIGWNASQVYTSTLLSQFNLLIFWHPGMWLLTIFIVMRLFIGKKNNDNQKVKRSILCFQLIAFLPMFLLVDIGRWIFMWVSSSALLFAFLIQIFGVRKILFYCLEFKGAKTLPKIIPRFTSVNNYNLFLLFLGIPHCCWSVGRYLVSNPIGFFVKNIIFYYKALLT